MYWLALTIWIAAIASAGVAASGVFTVLPRLGLTIEQYEPALGGDTAEHGRLAGGMVMEPIFAGADVAQVAAGIVLAITLILQLTIFNMRWRSPANLIRTICIAMAVALVVIHVAAIAPRMNRELRAYWQAVSSNDQDSMRAHREAFDADHRGANRLYQWRLLALLVAVVSSGAAFTCSQRSASTTTS